MAVTCSFKEKRGNIWLRDNEGNPVKCQAWAGGNCILVITYGKQKSLQCFFSDLQHLKRCAKDSLLGGWFAKAELSIDLPYAKDIAAIFAKSGVQTTLFPSSHKFK